MLKLWLWIEAAYSSRVFCGCRMGISEEHITFFFRAGNWSKNLRWLVFRSLKESRELWLVHKKTNGCELWFVRTGKDGGKIIPVPNLGVEWRWVVNFTSLPLYPRGNSSQYPSHRVLGGSPGQCTRNCVVWNGDPLISKSSAWETSLPVLGGLLWWPPQGFQNKKNRPQRKFWGQYTHCISRSVKSSGRNWMSHNDFHVQRFTTHIHRNINISNGSHKPLTFHFGEEWSQPKLHNFRRSIQDVISNMLFHMPAIPELLI
jgi:hypothetical protein